MDGSKAQTEVSWLMFDATECPICKESDTKSLRVLPCLHVTCFECLEKIADESPQCPICRSVFEINGVTCRIYRNFATPDGLTKSFLSACQKLRLSDDCEDDDQYDVGNEYVLSINTAIKEWIDDKKFETMDTKIKEETAKIRQSVEVLL